MPLLSNRELQQTRCASLQIFNPGIISRPGRDQPRALGSRRRQRDDVKLGGTTLVAHLTPGHTKGCTTWTMKVNARGKSWNVVIVGSPNVNEGYKLAGHALYPNIAQDYERTFRVLKSLPVDYFLGAHGAYFDMEAKYARMKEGAPSPFIDPDGYMKYATEREQAFQKELARQRQPR